MPPTFTYEVINERSGLEIVSIEPWVTEFVLPAGGRIEIDMVGDKTGSIEISTGRGLTSVWPLQAHSIVVIQDGDRERAVEVD